MCGSKIDLVASTPTFVVVPSTSDATGSREEPLALGIMIISSSPFTLVAIAYSISCGSKISTSSSTTTTCFNDGCAQVQP